MIGTFDTDLVNAASIGATSKELSSYFRSLIYEFTMTAVAQGLRGSERVYDGDKIGVISTVGWSIIEMLFGDNG